MTAKAEVMTRETREEPGAALVQRADSSLPAPTGETASTVLAAREKAAVEARAIIAIQRPRSVDQARLRILEACRRPRFADAVQYSKPVGGKHVTGLSIRFAEEAARCWGNLDVRSIIVFDDRERRIYKVIATDLETNLAYDQDVIVEKVVERRSVREGDEVIGRRVNSSGQTVYLKAATEDEIFTKSNAMLSKARRNQILNHIPPDIKEEAEETALETLKHRDAKDPDAARKQIMDAFYSLGVMPNQLIDVMGKPMEQLSPAEMQLLRTMFTALRDGEATWDEIASDESLARMRGKNAGTGTDGAAEKKSDKGTAGLKAAVGKKVPAPTSEDAAEEARIRAEEAAGK